MAYVLARAPIRTALASVLSQLLVHVLVLVQLARCVEVMRTSSFRVIDRHSIR